MGGDDNGKYEVEDGHEVVDEDGKEEQDEDKDMEEVEEYREVKFLELTLRECDDVKRRKVWKHVPDVYGITPSNMRSFVKRVSVDEGYCDDAEGTDSDGEYDIYPEYSFEWNEYAFQGDFGSNFGIRIRNDISSKQRKSDIGCAYFAFKCGNHFPLRKEKADDCTSDKLCRLCNY